MTRGRVQWSQRVARPVRERPMLVLGTGLGIGAFIGGYLITMLLFFSGGPSDVVTVPDLRGLSATEARQQLRRRGLDLERGSSLVHPEMPAGAVLAQSPLPGQEVAPESEVRVTLSAGRIRMQVPDVAALTGEHAQSLLARTGFQVVIDSVPNARAAGRIVDVRPAPGTQVQLPAQVRLIVSTGPPQVPVPELYGLAEAAAREALQAAGLRLGDIEYDPYAPQPLGEIISQRPGSGGTIAAGSRVHVTISGFPPIEATVPADTGEIAQPARDAPAVPPRAPAELPGGEP